MLDFRGSSEKSVLRREGGWLHPTGMKGERRMGFRVFRAFHSHFSLSTRCQGNVDETPVVLGPLLCGMVSTARERRGRDQKWCRVYAASVDSVHRLGFRRLSTDGDRFERNLTH